MNFKPICLIWLFIIPITGPASLAMQNNSKFFDHTDYADFNDYTYHYDDSLFYLFKSIPAGNAQEEPEPAQIEPANKDDMDWHQFTMDLTEQDLGSMLDSSLPNFLPENMIIPAELRPNWATWTFTASGKLLSLESCPCPPKGSLFELLPPPKKFLFLSEHSPVIDPSDFNSSSSPQKSRKTGGRKEKCPQGVKSQLKPVPKCKCS